MSCCKAISSVQQSCWNPEMALIPKLCKEVCRAFTKAVSLPTAAWNNVMHLSSAHRPINVAPLLVIGWSPSQISSSCWMQTGRNTCLDRNVWLSAWLNCRPTSQIYLPWKQQRALLSIFLMKIGQCICRMSFWFNSRAWLTKQWTHDFCIHVYASWCPIQDTDNCPYSMPMTRCEMKMLRILQHPAQCSKNKPTLKLYWVTVTLRKKWTVLKKNMEEEKIYENF